MGNCLNCVGNGQQDNANLLGNSSDLAATVEDTHRASLPYNVFKFFSIVLKSLYIYFF